MARKPKPTSSRNYFTRETEDYIVKYNQTQDPVERNRIFTEHLYYPFYKLAENIIHTFKFYKTDVDRIEDLKLDVITMLVQGQKLEKFDPARGTKAFSYFGTIIKRWLIAYCDANYTRELRQIPLDNNYDEAWGEVKEVETSATVSLSRFLDEWVASVYQDLETLFPKESDQQIADAILTVFRTRQNLNILKKKALYLYVREITGCETPYLTKVVRKLRDNFYQKYQTYLDTGLVLDESSDD